LREKELRESKRTFGEKDDEEEEKERCVACGRSRDQCEELVESRKNFSYCSGWCVLVSLFPVSYDELTVQPL
jgi:hypothetical protein